MKNDILNCVLFCPKNEWNPHSNVLDFSWYGLCGANIRLRDNNIKAKMGIKHKKKVIEFILCEHIYS